MSPKTTDNNIENESHRIKINFQKNGKYKKVGIAIPLSDKVNSDLNFLRRDKEGGKSPNNLITVSMTTSNVGAPNFIKKILKGTKC